MFTFGSYEFPQKYIKYGAVNVKPNQRQDKDSYADGFGVTQRNALAHTKTEIQFTTLEMPAAVMRAIMDGIASNYINPLERDANCTYYDDEYGVMKTGHFYLDPSLAFPKKENNHDGTPKIYGEINWTFIEY